MKELVLECSHLRLGECNGGNAFVPL